MPQPPQFRSSVKMFTHWGDAPAPQSRMSALTVQVQLPLPQLPAPQTWPHPPQLDGSVATFTHSGETDGPHEV